MKELFFPLTMIVISTLATPAFAKDKLPTNAVNAIEQTLIKYYGNQYQNDCLFFSHDEITINESLNAFTISGNKLSAKESAARSLVPVILNRSAKTSAVSLYADFL